MRLLSINNIVSLFLVFGSFKHHHLVQASYDAYCYRYDSSYGGMCFKQRRQGLTPAYNADPDSCNENQFDYYLNDVSGDCWIYNYPETAAGETVALPNVGYICCDKYDDSLTGQVEACQECEYENTPFLVYDEPPTTCIGGYLDLSDNTCQDDRTWVCCESEDCSECDLNGPKACEYPELCQYTECPVSYKGQQDVNDPETCIVNPALPDPDDGDDGDNKDSGVMGDPHVKLWNNTYIDIMAECDVVMIHDPLFYHGTSLDIHLRLTNRYDYSFIESAALKIGEDILEVTSFGEYALNGIDHAELDGMDLDGFPIYYSHPNAKEHVFDVLIGPRAYITLSTFNDMVSVKIHHGVKSKFGKSEGILGSFDGKMLGRDGTTVFNDPTEFGQEWQVHETEPLLFRTTRAPQYPKEKCILASEKQLRKNGQLSQSDAENACAHLEEEQRKAACIKDVLLVQDLDIAKVAAY